MEFLKSIDRLLAKLEGWLIMVFLWTMIFFTFVQVLLRGLFTHAGLQWANAIMGHIDWSEALVRLLVLWLAFLGASLLTSENKHIKIDLFSEILPRKWLPLRELVLSMACVFICGMMLMVSIEYVKLEMDFGGSTFLNLPNWIGELILPTGFAAILFRFLVRTLDNGVEFLRGLAR